MTAQKEVARGPSRAGWHSIESFHFCPKEHQLRHVRKVTRSHEQLPEPLAVGILVHFGRAWWFESGFRNDVKVQADLRNLLEEEVLKHGLPMSADAARQALLLLEGYIEHWSKMPLPTPILVEHEIEGWMGDGKDVERTARLDDVSLYPEGLGKLFIGELKTTSEGVEGLLKQYQLHGQPLLQRLLWKKWTEKQLALPAKLRKLKVKDLAPAAGTMLDIIVKPGKAGARPKYIRHPLYVPDWTLKWFEESIAEYVVEAGQVTWDTPVRRNTAVCTRLISGVRIPCAFAQLCMYGPEGTNGYTLEGGAPLHDRKHWKGETPPWA